MWFRIQSVVTRATSDVWVDHLGVVLGTGDTTSGRYLHHDLFGGPGECRFVGRVVTAPGRFSDDCEVEDCACPQRLADMLAESPASRDNRVFGRCGSR